MQRAYSVLTIKAVSDDERVIEGIASTPSPDRMGDIVEPDGAEFKLPIPLLWQHDSRQPIGEVFAAKVSSAGITIKARIRKIEEAGNLKDRLDEAWQSIKHELVRGLSIGFSSLEYSRLENGGLRFIKWAWLELSAVTIPANQEATIQAIKSFDTGRPAASGTEVRADSPDNKPRVRGVVRARDNQSRRQDAPMKKSYSEQITEFQNTRAAKAARMDDLLEKAAEAGETLDAQAKEEYDQLDGEVKEIDAHLVRLKAAEDRQKAAAVEVKGANTEEGAKARGNGGTSVIALDKKLDPGMRFARYVACKAASAVEVRSGNFVSPLEIAKSRYADDSLLRAVFEKSAVPAGITSASNAYDDLVPYQVLANDFIEFLRGKTIIDRFGQDGIPALRRVPFNIRVGGFSSGTTGYWKGEALPTPMSKAASTNVTLTWATVSGLTAISKEMARFSTPSVELALRDDLARAVIERMDIDFVDPEKAAVANTSPASITYGLAANAPSGTAAANVRKDLATLFAAFATAKLGRSNLVLIMSDTMAGNIAMMVNTLGNRDFPEMDLSARVPRLAGIPVITSEHLTSVGSPSTQTIVMVKADEVYLADDGMVDVEASFEASIEMLDASLVQDGTAGTGTSLVNLWQSGLIGLLANRVVNWKLRRSTAVEYISPAAYAPPSS